MYQIQIKSTANLSEFKQNKNEFPPKGFKKLYFVAHTLKPNLFSYGKEHDNVELICSQRLAVMVIDLGSRRLTIKKG